MPGLSQERRYDHLVLSRLPSFDRSPGHLACWQLHGRRIQTALSSASQLRCRSEEHPGQKSPARRRPPPSPPLGMHPHHRIRARGIRARCRGRRPPRQGNHRLRKTRRHPRRRDVSELLRKMDRLVLRYCKTEAGTPSPVPGKPPASFATSARPPRRNRFPQLPPPDSTSHGSGSPPGAAALPLPEKCQRQRESIPRYQARHVILK